MDSRSRFNQTTEEAENQKRQKQLRNWQTKDLIEATHQSTRMTWLYNTLTRYGNIHEFSPAAKEWVKSKVATEDVASWAEDPTVNAVWWEDNMTPQRRASFHQNTLPPQSQAQNLPMSPRKTVSEQFSPSTALDTANQYRPTLIEVLNNPVGIGELSEALDVEGLSSHFDFLLAVANLKQAISLLAPDSDVPDLEVQRGVEIIQTFLVKQGNSSIAGDLSPTSVSIAAQAFNSRGKSKAQVAGTAFDPCLDEIKKMLTPLWDDFRQQDAYLELCAALDPTVIAKQQQQTQNSSLLMAISGSETFSQAGCPPLHIWYPVKAPNWINHVGYQSIRITVHSTRGPCVQRYANNLYCVFGSGSRLLKHACAGTNPGDFNITCQLPICNTTPFVWVMIGAQGKCLGVLPLAMSDLLVRSSDGPLCYKLRTEAVPGTLDDTLRDKVIFSTSQLGGSAQSITGVDEIVITYALSTESPTDNLEGSFKCIFSDDTASGGFGDFIRGKVSKKKKRFSDDNFNLDLTYITPTIIAMGFPSEGAEGVYRNPLKQVQQFFLLRHPHSYRIYNLCSERSYDITKFESRCEHFPFDDHNPPPFSMIRAFCESVRKFLAESPQNVVSIHCKAGKGRTGTMIAAYLIYAAGLTAAQALYQFGTVRTSNGQGVTIASQIQYVHYFDHYCALRRAQKAGPGRCTLFLESISLRNIGSKFNNSEITWQIHMPNRILDDETMQVVETSKPVTITPPSKPIRSANGNSYTWNLESKIFELHEDVRFEFSAKSGMSKEKLLHAWINTRMIRISVEDGRPIARIYKPFLDKASKDTKHKKFDYDFHLELVFTPVETAAQKRLQMLDVPNRPDFLQPTQAPSL